MPRFLKCFPLVCMVFKNSGTPLLNLIELYKTKYNAKLDISPHKNHFLSGHRLFKGNSHHVNIISIICRFYIYFTSNPKLVPLY